MIKRIIKKVILIFVIGISFVLNGCNNKEIVNSNQVELVKKEKWAELGNDIFVFTSKFYQVNMVLIASEKEAVLIDTGMYDEEYQNIKEFIAEKNVKLKTIILTHGHDDHVSNLDKFKEDDTKLITPDNAQDNQIIFIGDKSLKIMYTEGHYKPHGHISVEVVNQDIIITGDIIDNDSVSTIASGATGGIIKNYLETLKNLRNKNYKIVIPGHGAIGGNEIFNNHFEYFSNAKLKVEEHIKNGGIKQDLYKIGIKHCVSEISPLRNMNFGNFHIKTLEAIYDQFELEMK